MGVAIMIMIPVATARSDCDVPGIWLGINLHLK